MKAKLEELLDPKAILDLLVDKKASKVLLLKVAEQCSYAENIVIANGGNSRHVLALANYIVDVWGKPISSEGKDVGDWVLLDYGETIVHLFTPSIRRHYDLEELFESSEQIQVTDDFANEELPLEEPQHA